MTAVCACCLSFPLSPSCWLFLRTFNLPAFQYHEQYCCLPQNDSQQIMQVTYMYTDYGLVVKTTKTTELNRLIQEVTKDCVSLQSLFFTASCQQMLSLPQVKDFTVALSTLQDILQLLNKIMRSD